MTTYTYEIVYINNSRTTLVKCDRPINFNILESRSIVVVNTPSGRQAINMANVLFITEIINKED